MRTLGQLIGCFGLLACPVLLLLALWGAGFSDTPRGAPIPYLVAAAFAGIFGLVLLAVSRWARQNSVGPLLGFLGAVTGVVLGFIALYAGAFSDTSRGLVIAFLVAAPIAGIIGLVLLAARRGARPR